MEGSNYEGLGWTVFDAADRLDPRVREHYQDRHRQLLFASGGPTSGDELTFFMTREVMRKFSPRLLVVVFSDVEVAHFGSYALHLAGIRTADRLAYQLWQEVEANPEYKGKTTMLILPEFGRDPDGSSTNGFLQSPRQRRIDPEHLDDGSGRRSTSRKSSNVPSGTSIFAHSGGLAGLSAAWVRKARRCAEFRQV